MEKSVSGALNVLFCTQPESTPNCLAISVFDTYDDIVTRCCEAWNFFANDPQRVRSISDREYARTVNL